MPHTGPKLLKQRRGTRIVPATHHFKNFGLLGLKGERQGAGPRSRPSRCMSVGGCTLGPPDLACGPHHEGLPRHGEEGSGIRGDYRHGERVSSGLQPRTTPTPFRNHIRRTRRVALQAFLDKRLTPLDLGVVISSNWQDLWQVV